MNALFIIAILLFITAVAVFVNYIWGVSTVFARIRQKVMPLGNTDINVIGYIMERNIASISEEFGEGKTGGYLFICNPKGTWRFHQKFGIVPDDKVDKYRAFSAEKALRLLKNKGHLTSYQSRNPLKEQWGGAIRLPNGYIISFSGFPELVDEALCASIGRVMNLMSHNYTEKALSASKNAWRYKYFCKHILAE